MEKPWVVRDAVADRHDGSAFSVPISALGLRVFLAVITVLFSLLIVAYGSRMEFENWRPSPQPGLLWLNTALLVMSSIAMQWALTAARRGEVDGVRNGLVVGGGFAAAFLAGQLAAWQQLADWGFFAATNPAVAFFYLITGLHGLHLLGGLVVWANVTTRVWRGPDVARVRLTVELCTIYWHFLLLVWLILFGLLFSGNDNLNFVLELCGIR